MKVCSIIGLIVLSIVIVPFTVTAYTIDDSAGGTNTYWGGATFGSGDTAATGPTQPSTKDYIGGPVYDINGMNVTVAGNRMTVEIVSNYFTTGQGTSGDLYISSTGWHVSNTSGGPNYPYDIFGSFQNGTLTNTEGWDYVVGWYFGSNFVPVGTVYTLNQNFALTGSGFEPIEFSNCSSSQCRNDQAYVHGYEDVVESANVAFGISGDGVTPDMTFSFDISPANSAYPFLKNSTNVGFHWTMSCGNDVVEGNVPLQVPEPGVLFLLSFGLAGLGIYRRRAS